MPGTHEVGAFMASASPGSSGRSEEFCLGSRAPDPRAAQGVAMGPEAWVPPAGPFSDPQASIMKSSQHLPPASLVPVERPPRSLWVF